MDFCGQCGILLDLDIICKRQFFCNPCQNLSQLLYNTSPSAKCECEICCYKDEKGDSIFLKDSAYDQDLERNLPSEFSPKRQGKWQKQKRRSKRSHAFAALRGEQVITASKPVRSRLSSSSNSNTEKPVLTSPVTQIDAESSVILPTDLAVDSSNLLNYDSGSAHVISSSFQPKVCFTTDLYASSPPFSMGLCNSASTHPGSALKEEDNDQGNENVNTSKKYFLVEKVRVQWEREQKDYRQKLLYEDTPEIAALVGGQRRKEDGRRYFIGGVDISFIKGNNEDACACLSVLRMPDLKLVYQRLEMVKLTQPYIPGFLAFREVPALQSLFDHLKTAAPQYWPDITLVDGNGILHPRGFGLACQLGVVLNIPTIGIAKSLISAQGISEDQQHKTQKRSLDKAGHGFDLISDAGEVLGKCVRVHDNAPNPVYVSLGHKVSLASAVWLALECSKYRIPEPVRRADLDSREYLRQGKTEVEEFLLTDSEDEDE